MNTKKVIICLVLSIALIFPCVLYGCKPEDKNESFDASFMFDAPNLPEEKPASYPLSEGGHTFYVSSTGTHSNWGDNIYTSTEEDPLNYDSISWNIGKYLGPGDRVLFKRGDTFNNGLRIAKTDENGNRIPISGADDNPITIASYGEANERPVINKEVNNGSCVVEASYCSNLVIRDLEIVADGPTRKGAVSPDSVIYVTYPMVGNGSYKNIWIVNNIVRAKDFDDNVRGICVGTSENFNSLPEQTVLEGLWITNNEVYNMARIGIDIGGWILNKGCSIARPHIFENVHIEDNIIHDNGTVGIMLFSSTDSVICRNLVYGTGLFELDDNSYLEGEAGICVGSVERCAIEYNVVYDARDQRSTYDSMGIDIDWNTENVVVRYNHCYNNYGSGVSAMTGVDCKIINNRIENNRTWTNQFGQITICGFRGQDGIYNESVLDPEIFRVENFEIAENLIVASPPDPQSLLSKALDKRSMFAVYNENTTVPWSNNSFHNNHVVNTGAGNEKYFYYNMIVSSEDRIYYKDAEWNKFEKNKYYANDLSSFQCWDRTPADKISSGATAYFTGTAFDSWAKRDLESTFEKYDPNATPSKPTNADVTFEDGKLKILWDSSDENLWHYNVFMVSEGEQVDYRRLVDEIPATDTHIELTPESKGVVYVVVQPESNTGLLGEALRIRVILK